MMQLIAPVLYFILGLVQFFATIAGVQVWLGIHWFFAALIAGFLAWFPIIGTVAAVAGAHYAWGWSWLAAILLFVGPLVVAMALFWLEKARARPPWEREPGTE